MIRSLSFSNWSIHVDAPSDLLGLSSLIISMYLSMAAS